MSRENVDLVGTLIPQGTDIAPLFRSERAFARVSEVLAPLVEEDFENVVSVPGQTRTDEGVEGLRRNWLDWLEPWAEYRVSIEEVVDLGERVLVLTRHYGRRTELEADVEMIAAVILTFRDGKVTRWEDYADRADGLAAASGAEPQTG